MINLVTQVYNEKHNVSDSEFIYKVYVTNKRIYMRFILFYNFHFDYYLRCLKKIECDKIQCDFK